MFCPGTLQVVESSYCMVLEAFWNDDFAIFTEEFGVFDQQEGVTFLLSILNQGFVLLLCLCYLSGSEGIDGVFFD